MVYPKIVLAIVDANVITEDNEEVMQSMARFLLLFCTTNDLDTRISLLERDGYSNIKPLCVVRSSHDHKINVRQIMINLDFQIKLVIKSGDKYSQLRDTFIVRQNVIDEFINYFELTFS